MSSAPADENIRMFSIHIFSRNPRCLSCIFTIEYSNKIPTTENVPAYSMKMEIRITTNRQLEILILKFSFRLSIEDFKTITKCTDSNTKVYPFKQFSRALGSTTLIDAPSTDTVEICLLEMEKGTKKKKRKKASLVGLTGDRS